LQVSAADVAAVQATELLPSCCIVSWPSVTLLVRRRPAPHLLLRRYLSAVQRRPDQSATWHHRHPPCPNLPTDPDNVSRDDLVFASSTMHLVSTNLDFIVPVNPRSCVATATIHQTGEIVGGTGQFANATGSGIGTVTGPAVLARNPDGSCNFEHVALHEVDMVTSTGTLSF
jgi:hypothetical protein